MDETEITNSEYRQFVNWTRNSIVRQRLAEEAEIAGGNGSQGGGGKGGSINDFAFKGSSSENDDTETPYQQYSKHYDPNNQRLNWKPELIWEAADYPDESYVYVMDEIYLPMEQSYNGQRLMDVTQFKYNYKYMDIEAAARSNGR